jgi:pimeloyl-ACP methyl ester carboxylesterase
VLALDLRGHGWSTRAETGYGPSALAADIVEVLRNRSVAPVVAVGHSMGAQVVTSLAVEYPDLVAAVVVIDPAYGATGDEIGLIPRRLDDLRARGWPAAWEITRSGFLPSSPPVLRTRHARAMRAMTAAALAGCYEGMYTAAGAYGIRPASELYLSRRTCPTMGFYSRPDAAAWEQPLLGDRSRVVVWEGSGHYLHEERPAEFCLLLDSWVQGLEGLARPSGPVVDGTGPGPRAFTRGMKSPTLEETL